MDIVLELEVCPEKRVTKKTSTAINPVIQANPIFRLRRKEAIFLSSLLVDFEMVDSSSSSLAILTVKVVCKMISAITMMVINTISQKYT